MARHGVIIKVAVTPTEAILSAKDMGGTTPSVVEATTIAMVKAHNIISENLRHLFERVSFLPLSRPVIFQQILETIIPIVVDCGSVVTIVNLFWNLTGHVRSKWPFQGKHFPKQNRKRILAEQEMRKLTYFVADFRHASQLSASHRG